MNKIIIMIISNYYENLMSMYLMGSEIVMLCFLMYSSGIALQPNTKGHLKIPLWKLSTSI